MSNIRELSFDEIALVSGGNANSNYEGGGSRSRNTGARNSLGRNAPTHIYSARAQLNVLMLSLVEWLVVPLKVVL